MKAVAPARREAAAARADSAGGRSSPALPPAALHRRPRAVGGQRERGQLAAEALPPVGELRLQVQLALPDRIVGVLQRHGRQAGIRPAGRQGRIQDRELANHHAHGPAIGDDVVLGDDEDALGLPGLSPRVDEQ
jgi:hypothetical protein